MEVLFLGTGTSHGVPAVDCIMTDYKHCPQKVCLEALSNPMHNRTRSSVIFSLNGKNILIDISPDFREQILREKITALDVVLITHKHADHIMGLPDIRSFTRVHPIEVFASGESINALKQSFSYAFNPNTFIGGGIPELLTRVIDGEFEIFGSKIVPIPIIHGTMKEALGYRINNVAYIPDVKFIPDSSMNLLKGTEILIIDGLRKKIPHSTHVTLEESISIAQILNVQRVYFTHLSHDIHFQNDSALLPENMYFAHDGLKIKI